MIKRKNQKISIIIPVYNAEKTLEACLNSIIDQDYPNYEIIVVDNNSTDSTKQIILQFQKENPMIKYVFESKIGRGSARNAGINFATGEIIAMTDSDCIVPKNWISELTYSLRINNEKAVQGGESEAFSNFWTENIQKSNERFVLRHLSKDKKYTLHLDTKNFAILAPILKSLMFDDKIRNIEDFELSLRLRSMIKIRYIEEIKVKHFHRSSLIQFFSMQFDRAYWAYIIFQKHKHLIKAKEEVMFGSLSFKNYFIFPLWITKQLISNFSIGFFLLVSNFAWALGTIHGIIKSSLNFTSLKK